MSALLDSSRTQLESLQKEYESYRKKTRLATVKLPAGARDGETARQDGSAEEPSDGAGGRAGDVDAREGGKREQAAADASGAGGPNDCGDATGAGGGGAGRKRLLL